jgi:hypothetical protein
MSLGKVFFPYFKEELTGCREFALLTYVIYDCHISPKGEVLNSAHQLHNIKFETGKKQHHGESILVDGYQYRYIYTVIFFMSEGFKFLVLYCDGNESGRFNICATVPLN